MRLNVGPTIVRLAGCDLAVGIVGDVLCWARANAEVEGSETELPQGLACNEIYTVNS